VLISLEPAGAPKSTTSKTAKVAVEGTRSKNANGLTFLQQQKADAQAERQFLSQSSLSLARRVRSHSQSRAEGDGVGAEGAVITH
jgi:hypothetical protein